MSEFNKILDKFKPVLLSEIEEVKLMSRVDSKFWFHVSELNELLEKALPDYNILEINGQRLMHYETVYYDTHKDSMYRFHHNGKRNRYKIRKRRYHSTNDNYLEIKFKNNKQRTIKDRIKIAKHGGDIDSAEKEFINVNSPYGDEQLNQALQNRFQRITLVNKNKTDRCTIDLNLEFVNESGKAGLEGLVVVEIKRSKKQKSSPLLLLLREKRIRQRGLSKYCTGRALLEPALKQNAFKARLRYLKRNITFSTN